MVRAPIQSLASQKTPCPLKTRQEPGKQCSWCGLPMLKQLCLGAGQNDIIERGSDERGDRGADSKVAYNLGDNRKSRKSERKGRIAVDAVVLLQR